MRFTLTPAHREFCNAQGRRVVEPRDFRVFVGAPSATALEGRFAVE